MTRTAAGMSVTELEKILDERKHLLHELAKRRDQMQKELEKIDEQIQEIVGVGAKEIRRKKRPKNEMPLRDVVMDVLGKSKKGFTLPDLEIKVNESGYKSASKNFKNVLYQCLYNTEGVVHDDSTGCYRLEKDQ